MFKVLTRFIFFFGNSFCPFLALAAPRYLNHLISGPPLGRAMKGLYHITQALVNTQKWYM